MVSEKEMGETLRTLKKFVRQFDEPAVTEVSRHSTPFHVLVSCLLSLRTRDATTRAVSERLFSNANSPEDILALPMKRLESLVRPVNYYKTKARRIRDVCRNIIKNGGAVPDTMEELLKLKGVGRKTANIVLVYGHGKEGLPIDVHCWRIPNRLGWIDEKTPEKAELALRKILPRRYWNDFNNIFVTFGQNHCLPRNPKCGTCPVSRHCKYYKNIFMKKENSNQVL